VAFCVDPARTSGHRAADGEDAALSGGLGAGARRQRLADERAHEHPQRPADRLPDSPSHGHAQADRDVHSAKPNPHGDGSSERDAHCDEPSRECDAHGEPYPADVEPIGHGPPPYAHADGHSRAALARAQAH